MTKLIIQHVSYFELQLFAQTKDVQIFGLHEVHFELKMAQIIIALMTPNARYLSYNLNWLDYKHTDKFTRNRGEIGIIIKRVNDSMRKHNCY